jgi:tetratricopeptide (TPR) repeat protein
LRARAKRRYHGPLSSAKDERSPCDRRGSAASERVAELRTDTGRPSVKPASSRAPAGGPLKLSNYLGILRDDPHDDEAFAGLKALVQSRDAARLGDQPVRLLEIARGAHEARSEPVAVARLLEAEALLVAGDADFEASLWKELGRLRAEQLLDPHGALEAYQRAATLRRGDAEVTDAIKRIEQAEANWGKFVKSFTDEAETAGDVALKSSLLVRAACLVWQYKKKGREKESDKLFENVFAIDPGNARAAQLFEHTLRERKDWKALAGHLVASAERVPDARDRMCFSLRAGRVLSRQMNDAEGAASAYRGVLVVEPANEEAMTFLAAQYTAAERWDDLVKLYEGALAVPQKIDAEQGTLLQVGMVHWRMRGRAEAAEPYFARLRKLDAAHPAMLSFYREYLGGRGQVDALLALLADAQRVAGDPAVKLELALELAQTAEQHPNLTDRAIEAWKLVQRLDPRNEKAGSVLKRLYTTAEKWNALVEVIKAQVEATPDSQRDRKVGLLRELLMIYRDRLSMDGMVINTLNAIAKLVPGDRSTLDDLAAQYESMGRWNDLIGVLSADAESQTDKARKVEMLLRVASLWIEHFANYNQATGPLEKVLEIEAENRQALVQLKDIYARKRAWKPLYDVLSKEKTVASDPAVRLANTVEMARLASDRLQRHGDAIAHWKEALTIDPSLWEAAEALAKLSERERDWDTLAGALEREFEHASANEARVRVLQKLGALYQDELKDPARAAGAWRRILGIDPRHGRALRALRDSLVAAQDWDGLEDLYAESGDWEALVDVLGSEADQNADPAIKVELSFRAARIFEDRLGAPERAARSYERVFAVDPKNLRAARALAVIYERDEKWARLRVVLDLILSALPAKDKEERLRLLARLGELAQERLRDGEAAFGYAAAAYKIAPDDQDVRAGLELTAEAAAAFERVVVLYRARAEQAPADEALELRRRVAAISGDRLGDAEVAAAQYEKVLEAVPDDLEALGALERIYRAGQRSDRLHAVLERKLEHATDPGLRWTTLKDLAAIEEGVLSDPESAAERYRAMSEIDPADREVLAALDRLAVAGERWGEVARILERRGELEDETSARVEFGGRLGLVKLDKLNDAEGAMDTFVSVLGLEPSHGPTVLALERMHDAHPKLASQIGRALESVYEDSGRYDKLVNVLQKRLRVERDEAEVRRLRLRLAEVSGSKLGDAVGAYGAIESAFFETPSDRALWDQLAELADAAGQHKALANAYATAMEAGDLPQDDATELAVRVAKIYDEVLGHPEEAESFHRRVLAHEPLNDRSFEALKELYTGTERWEELQNLYKTRIDQTDDTGAKLDLLLQVCFLFEEILSKPDLAIETYERVLAIEPDHPAARRTLERLYEASERWRDLAKLLTGNLEQAIGQERIDLMVRLGELYEHKLNEPASAVDQCEAVLAEQPNHLRIQESLARLLSVESQRQRIATILEPLYEDQGAWADLAKVLEIQLADRATPDAKSELLMRIGELHEQRTRDGDAAFSAYTRAVEAEPGNRPAREALAKLASGREVYRRRRAEVLARAADAVQDASETQAEILLELATLLDEYLADYPAAERAYERLIGVDPENAPVVLQASRALERIHLGREDYALLAVDLDRQIRFETDHRARGQLLVRLAETCENMLERIDAAIGAHRRRLEIDPGDEDALRSLARLYERTASWADLVEVLKGLSETVRDEGERKALARRVGSVIEEKLEDHERAIEAYRDVVTAFGPDQEALTALSRLLEQAQRWQELLETLEQEEAIASDERVRAALRFRMAEAMRLHTGEVERAVEYLARVLEHDAKLVGALAALDAVMRDAEPELKIAAARVATPRYEALGAHDKLLVALEVLQSTDDPTDKLAALRHAASVAETRLRDVNLAFAYLGRAVRAGVEDDSIGALLAELHRLVEASAAWGPYAALLRDVAPNIADTGVRSAAHREVACVARDHLADNALAREYFGKILEDLPDDGNALDALETLNEEAGEHAALIDVLKRKAELTTDPRERRRLLSRQAEIHERGLDDADAAITVLEELLQEASDSAAYGSLERLYSAARRWDDLGAMLEQQLDRALDDRVGLRYRIALNCHQHQSDTARAIDFLRDALAEDLSHGPSVELLETIMGTTGPERAVAAEILESGYLARMEWAKLTAALEVRIEAEQDVEERKRLLVRLGQIYEDQLEDFAGALGIYARLFREEPRDQDVWDTLSRLAKVGNQWMRLGETLAEPLAEDPTDEDLAKLAVYAARVYDERVRDPARAASLYAKALRFDPSDERVFDALESAYRRSEAWDDLVPLYREQADAAQTDARRVDLLHRRATIFREVRRDPPAAIAAYREIIEIDPTDARAIQALEQLLSESENWEDLAEHLRGRVDRSSGTKDEIPLRLRLAKLHEEQRRDLVAALDAYEEILGLDPREPHAIEALERLVQAPEHRLRITRILEPVYQKLDQWKKLVVVYEAQVGIVEDEVERVRLLGEIGVLHEKRGHDMARASRAWSRAFVRDPENEDVRAQADRLAGRLGAWDDHVKTYEAALERAGDAAVRSSLLTTIARMHDERRGDPRAAIAAYERLIEHDKNDPAPLDALESLLMMVGDWAALARVLDRKVALAYSADERGEILRRIGSVQEGFLADNDAAIAAYARAVQENDTDEAAYEALDRLYTGTQRHEALRDVLARRVELTADPSDRVSLGLRLGALCEEQLRDAEKAIDAYRRVLDDDAANVTATNALGALFERGAMWSDLLENLKQRAAVAVTESERVQLRHRAGEVLERELNDIPEAIEMYREALAANPAYGPSIEALMRITRLPDYRAQAAEVVEPLLRSQRRFDDLVLLLEQGLEGITDPLERRTELQHLAEVHERGRANPRDAFTALGRALVEDPGDAEVHAELERLARGLGAWAELADALAKQASRAPDPTVASGLFRRVARICEEELRDDARAIEAFVSASAQDDDASETLVHLDRLYEKSERWKELLEVLERRIGAAADPAEKNDLLIRLGVLREERFQDGQGAFVAFREVLDYDTSDARALEGMERLGRNDALALDVIEVLDRCYRENGALDKVAGLYDIRIRLSHTNDERIRLLNEAAGIWEQELREPAHALSLRRCVFELDPKDTSVLDDLERLASASGSWEGLRGMVEGLAASGALPAKARKALNLRAADWYRDRLRDPTAEEGCLRAALASDAKLVDVHERLVGLLSAPDRAADLVTALRAWSEVESDDAAKVERLRQAGRLAEDALRDVTTAAECYEALLEVDANDAEALDDLARIRETQGRHSEVAALVARRLGREEDLGARVALRYRLAELQASRLQDMPAAIGTYEEMLAEAPDETRAMVELERLLSEAKRWKHLRARLERRLERAAGVAERSEVRSRLALLAEREFDDRDGAIAQLRAILGEDASNDAAAGELDRLYTAGEQWKDLVVLLDGRARLLSAAGDAGGEVALLRRICGVYEGKLGDGATALQVYGRIHALVPTDVDALTALVRLCKAAEAWRDAVSYLGALLALQDGAALIATGYELATIADERVGDADAAEAALLHVLSADPTRTETRERLKSLYEKHGAHAKLVRVLAEEEGSLADAGAKVALLNRIASIYTERLSDPGSAVTYLERAVALVPDDRDALLALCDLYITAGRQRDAIPVLEKIIASYAGRRAKEVAVYQHRLGQAHEGLGATDEALKHYDVAFKIDLTNTKILRDLGRLCLARGDLDRAQKTYRALLLQKLGPESGIEKSDVYYHLGEISAKQGDAMKAKAMLERAVAEGGGQHAAAQELLAKL